MTTRPPATSLLDRLVDERPAVLPDALLRDLGGLLNATGSGVGDDEQLLAGSVLNFGVAAWAGRPASPGALRELAERLRVALVRFEPRLAGPSIIVTPEPASAPRRDSSFSEPTLAFRIEAVWAADPSAAPICLRTEHDPGDGRIRRLEILSAGRR